MSKRIVLLLTNKGTLKLFVPFIIAITLYICKYIIFERHIDVQENSTLFIEFTQILSAVIVTKASLNVFRLNELLIEYKYHKIKFRIYTLLVITLIVFSICIFWNSTNLIHNNFTTKDVWTVPIYSVYLLLGFFINFVISFEVT